MNSRRAAEAKRWRASHVGKDNKVARDLSVAHDRAAIRVAKAAWYAEAARFRYAALTRSCQEKGRVRGKIQGRANKALQMTARLLLSQVAMFPQIEL